MTLPSDSPPRPGPAFVHSWIKPAVFALAYALAILAAARIASGAGAPAFRPMPGFLLAGLLVFPSRDRLRIFLSAGIGGLGANLLTGRGVPAAVGFSISDLAEAALALYMTLRIPGGARFLNDLTGTVRFFTRVIPLCAAFGALLSALTGRLFLGLDWPRPFAGGFLAGAAGLAVIVPAALAWAQRDQAWESDPQRHARFGLCAAGAMGVGYLTFTQPPWLMEMLGRPLPFATFPFFLWAALDFGARGAATLQLGVYLLSAWLDSRGQGPYRLGQSLGAGLVGPMQWLPFAAAFLSLCPAVLLRRQKRVEDELRMRDSRYRGLLSNSTLGVFVSTLDGLIIEANDAFLGMIRRGRADLEAGAIHSRDMVTPEYLSGAAERRRQFEKEGRMGPFDREWVLRDGSRLNTMFFAARLEGGEALCMVFDTNELKRTKLELLAVESRFKKMLESNILGVAVVNPDLIIEEANPAFLAITGYSRADLEAGAIHAPSLIASRPPEQRRSAESRLKANGSLPPQETEWTRKDGTPVTVFRGVTRLDESNRWLTVALDLTELKRTQAELEAAKAAAEAANAAKSEFLAHMSHEIRTPLNGLLGMVALLIDSRLDAEQAGYAKAARESGAHLLAIINQILDFSKIERGHMELESKPFVLDSVVDGALASVAETARKKGIELQKRMLPGVPSNLCGDAVRLKQVLLNLLGNAVKFSPEGRVEIAIRLLERRGNRCRIGFEVEDQGPGMAPETLTRLFQPFRQGDDPGARAAGGTGLGLAISRELARRMGGDIEVESRLGSGSRFRFHFEADALDAPEEAPRDGASPAEARPREPDWSRPPRVLVVDDHPVNVSVATIMLRKLGCAVDAVSDGAAALAAAAGGAYDLVFMDCQMPLMDGFETTRRLRAREAAEAANGGTAKRVPVVALTAHAVAGMREKCLEDGMDDYLAKPFSPEDIDRMVRKWIPAPAAPAAPARLLDHERLAALGAGPQGAEDTRRLLDLFLEAGRQSLVRIRADLGDGDAQALAKGLHRLKGSCATIGALALTEKLKEMEAVLADGGPAALEGHLDSLGLLFDRTEAAIARYPSRTPA